MIRLFIAAAVSALAFGAAQAQAQERAEAVFAGGCFWCIESDFEKLDGVVEAVSGYTGGDLENPTYEQVSHTDTGHFEAVRVTYDPAQVSYDTLLDHFWRNIDPFDADGQFCDTGPSYRSAIFVKPDQLDAAEESLVEIQAIFPTETIATEIRPLGEFWPAEDYHQNYYDENPLRYRFYRFTCRRNARLNDVWGDEALGLNAGH